MRELISIEQIVRNIIRLLENKLKRKVYEKEIHEAMMIKQYVFANWKKRNTRNSIHYFVSFCIRHKIKVEDVIYLESEKR